MAISREAIYAALYTRLSTNVALAALVRKFSRKSVDWDQIPPAQQPALILEVGDSSAQHEEGVPPIWTLAANVIVFARAPSDGVTPEASLHAVVDAIEVALERQTNETAGFPYGGNHHQTTLGGLVRMVTIQRVELFQGELGAKDQQAALLTLQLIAI